MLDPLLMAQNPELRQAKRFLIGFSGGLDSTVLLYLFSLWHKKGLLPQPVVALHLNHNMQDQAQKWQQHCQAWCQQRNITYVDASVDLCQQSGNQEAVARTARYSFFARHMQTGDFLCTAHHQDDQLETFLLRLARGSGITGFTAIARKKAFARGYLYRPLLDYPRSELQYFALQEKLCWMEDPSNRLQTFDRNYLRHQIIPLFKKRWPAIARIAVRSADSLAEEQRVITEYMQMLLQQCSNSMGGLSTDQLSQLSSATCNSLLRFWLQRSGHSSPSRARLKEIKRQMLMAQNDAQPLIIYGNTEVRRYKQHIYCMQKRTSAQPSALFAQPAFTQKPFLWQGEEVVDMYIGKLYLRKTPGQGLDPAKLSSDVRIGWRQSGSICKPAGSKHHKTLKKWLQEYQVPPWMRSRIPVLYLGPQVIAVVGLFICDGWEIKNHQEGLTLDWQID